MHRSPTHRHRLRPRLGGGLSVVRGGLRLMTLGALLVVLTGCGRPVVGGRGEVLAEGPVGAVWIRLEGTPYEMGWWQGRLLGDRIRALVPRARMSIAARATEGAFDQALPSYVAETLGPLSEAARQELDGISDATGVPTRVLLEAAVARGASRFHGAGVGLAGVLAVASGAAAGEGARPRMTATYTGPDAERLGAGWILVERRPTRGPATLVLSWPGSVGGVAGLREDGLGYLAVGREMPLEQQAVGRMPFPVLARRALETASDLASLLLAMERSVGHEVLALDARAEPVRVSVASVGLAASEDAIVPATGIFRVEAEAPTEAYVLVPVEDLPEVPADGALLTVGARAAGTEGGARFEVSLRAGALTLDRAWP